MARKNLLANVSAHLTTTADREVRSDYANRGASRSMMLSIEEMAENAKKMMAGETVVSLDPALLDESFVVDRVEDDEEEFANLKQGIETEGQLQPILVRPHPDTGGRFMIVFGHRRARAARELGIPVLAVVKNLEAIAHIIAQGQENSRRANLSFIEKALFATKLLSMGQSKETIRSALSIDDTLLSRMLSVVETVPAQVIEAIGAAKSVGRDRWEELKKLVANPKVAEYACDVVNAEAFRSLEGANRFNHLLGELKQAGQGRRKRKKAREGGVGVWSPDDRAVSASYQSTGKTFTLSLKSAHASEFGHFISSNLESLYRDFKEWKVRQQGE
ncbi:plasmid partitioning protein RepB [Chelatococcus sp. YT9]|uniref:plasmid partitioning protein RepB n=1 Tax=Chelatococcus sp. YT9 TaxID=2835635 RepID=UPI001BD02386|nr:plasmid partitioning protein RepB [Chelatococcus sp. YT9]MBS7701516.1 plasmid partitioning protein RepB [Chelatococcus sp. YT9]